MSNQADLIQLLIYSTVAILGLIIFTITRNKKKSKDMYCFNLPGWTPLKDSNELWEIEQEFKEGGLSKALSQKGYGIWNWHSNLKNETKTQFTGYISLVKLSKVVTAGSGNDWIKPGIAIADNTNFRYFKADLKKTFGSLVYFDSKKTESNGINLEDLATKFDSQFGLMEWKVIGYQDTLYILVPEIFLEAKMKEFLELSFKVLDQIET